jgi:hypothetical protein
VKCISVIPPTYHQFSTQSPSPLVPLSHLGTFHNRGSGNCSSCVTGCECNSPVYMATEILISYQLLSINFIPYIRVEQCVSLAILHLRQGFLSTPPLCTTLGLGETRSQPTTAWFPRNQLDPKWRHHTCQHVTFTRQNNEQLQSALKFDWGDDQATRGKWVFCMARAGGRARTCRHTNVRSLTYLAYLALLAQQAHLP